MYGRPQHRPAMWKQGQQPQHVRPHDEIGVSAANSARRTVLRVVSA